MSDPLSQPHVWNLVSPGYVEHNTSVFETFARHALAAVGDLTGKRLLDVATGPGSLALLAAKQATRVDALDFSPGMLAQLRARLAQTRLDNVHPIEGDGQALPYADGTFDAACSMFGLMFFPDRAQGFREMRRVLTPGGRAVVSSWARMDDIELFEVLFGALFDAAPALAPSEPPAPPPLSTVAAFEAEMSAAGFAVNVVEIEHPISAPSMTAYMAISRTSFAPVCLMEEQMGTAFGGVWQTVTERLIERFGDGPVHLSMRALLGVGTAA